jgi:4-hydroxy-tetrahydrodipicolinate reductase
MSMWIPPEDRMTPLTVVPIRVLVVGTGQIGSAIARVLLDRPGLVLAGAYGKRAERAGIDLGRAIGLDRDLGLPIHTDLDGAVTATRPHVAIQATCSRLVDAAREIETLVRRGVHVVSIAEEMAYPACASASLAEALHRLAVAHRVSILGTGINPGFVLDVLVVTLSAVCSGVESITATRVNDLAPYGPTVLRSQGVGLTPEAFQKELARGSVVGHVGFEQSIHMIADGLGCAIERIEQTREPIVSRVRRATPHVTVEPGHVAGCRHTAVGYRRGAPFITLVHPQQIRPELEGVATGDTIEIHGRPGVHLSGSPEIPGGDATAALAVNMIPRVLAAAPGLHTMLDLPVPAAMLGDALGPASHCEASKIMPESIPAGTWVEIHRIVLPPAARSPHIPDDTRRVPLEMRVKGHLAEPTAVGAEAVIVTAAGRRLWGVLAAVNPAYDHGFGSPIAELAVVGAEVRARLHERRRVG